MKITKLYSLAENHGVTVDRFSLPLNQSVSVCDDGRCFVAVDENLSKNQEKVCLAHELGHCETGSFYNIYSPFDIREKHEERANRWAISKLVPKYRFDKAVRNGFDNIYLLSEYFEVTPDFMQKAIDYYQKSS